jgi:hypothetical protein
MKNVSASVAPEKEMMRNVSLTPCSAQEVMEEV